MPILSAELKLYKSLVVTNDPTNGGRMSANESVDAVKNNIFPDVTEAQRSAGLADKRKVFYKVENDADLPAINVKNWLVDVTPGGSRVTLVAGSQVDTEGDLTGSERKYGVGRLNADVSAAATIIVIDAETGSGADLIFQDGDSILITDGVLEEFVAIAGSGVSWTGDQATVTITAGLANAYTAAANSTISSVLENAALNASVDNLVIVSTAGVYDDVGSPIAPDNIGSIEQIWTLTFSDATNFTVSGDSVGASGSGTIGTDTAPSNTDFTKPYFTLLAAGFSGTFLNGDTIVFQTHPAAVALWLLRTVDAGTGALALDDTTVAMSLEG